MRAVIFVGPTLAGHSALATSRFAWRGPAALGDVYRAAHDGAPAIGLIDGRFETVPTVWHKEILWALSQGIHVFGAASMGALRAAELADYGMIGVGRIYEDFRRGRLEDDEEVAVLHAPEELGYRPLTEAMVDIRATLAAARKAGIVTRRTAQHLVRAAKGLFFKERTWDEILAVGFDGRRRAQPAELRAWLVGNRVEQKRADAIAMVASLTRFLVERPPPHMSNFTFQFTEDWDRVVRESRAISAS